MAQHDYVIANDTAANVRSDLNDALSAIVSQNSGSTAPSTTYANMLWYDTANNILKMRSEADDAWINVGYFDQSANAFRILDDTQVVNTSGTQTGLLGDQTTATWETGTSTTESLVSPAKVKAAIEANASSLVFYARDEKTSGTDGGGVTSGGWRTRDLNTVVENGVSGASLASNEVTLPAGTYRVWARAPANKCNEHVIRLYNVTDSTEILIGSSAFNNSVGDYTHTDSVIWGETFTLAGTKNIRLEHRVTTTRSADGFGRAHGFGTNIFSELYLEVV